MGVDPLMSTWICVRQRAGPLVKECRYQRPTLRKGDLPSVQVDGKPWCEDCFDKAMGSGANHETN
mgnify:CR=1 FL=1